MFMRVSFVIRPIPPSAGVVWAEQRFFAHQVLYSTLVMDFRVFVNGSAGSASLLGVLALDNTPSLPSLDFSLQVVPVPAGSLMRFFVAQLCSGSQRSGAARP